MTFKTNLPPASCPALSGFGVLGISGPDSARFLQSQLMNDVAALAPGQWQWNGWLTPKGRVIALFALLRLADDRFLLVLPDLAATDFKALLQRFVFRSKLTIDDAPGWTAAAGPIEAAPAPDRFAGEPPQALALDWGDAGQPRTLWLLPLTHEALAATCPTRDADWRAQDLGYGLPRLSAAQREAWTPQMLSLDRLGAFSLNKGCYPGQEIVARTHYLGKSKRQLVLLVAEADLTEGGAVCDADGRELGTLVSVLNHADGAKALAVLPADLNAGTTLTAGVRLAVLPLRAGLAR
ncbi:CAF17-like 4Fe-4S cluster assembly/insertion protein YgfZ [Arenimonas alkanexedens]